MKYDPKKSLNENKVLILSEQSAKVGDYTVSYEGGRIKVDSPSGRTYYWTTSGGWYRVTYNLGIEEFTDLDKTKEWKTISTLNSVFKKSGIGSSFYLRNMDQGNKFRSWVHKKDPNFAKNIDLSLTGPYDNEYIHKAWAKYGSDYKNYLTSNKPESDTDRAIKDLKLKGLDGSGAISMNQAYALAAVRATKKLTDIISGRIFGAGDSPYFVCIKKVGSTCSPGSYLVTDTFNIKMSEEINSRKDQNSGGLKPPQYTLLTNFYFDYGKIMNDLTSAFKYNKNAYKSVLFPDGWWNWFTSYWGTDNITQISLAQKPKNVIVPGGGGGYPTGGLTSSDVHSFLTVVEIGSLLLAFIPSPLSPILFGLSSVAGLADAGTYFYEGDKYMGSMMLALEIIPGGELMKFFKGSKTAYKLGKEGTIELLEKGAKGTLEQNEKALYKELSSELKIIDKEITQAAKKQMGKEITENLTQNFIKATKNYTTKDKLKALYQLIALTWKSIGSVPRMVINVGGTMVGIDQLYLALFGRDEDRQKSDIRKVYYLIQGKGLPEDEEIIRNVGVVQEFIKQNGSEETAAGMVNVADKESLNKNSEFLIDKYSNKPQDENSKDEEPKDEDSQDEEPLFTSNEPKNNSEDLEIEKLSQNKDSYNFYIWSKRLEKWNNVTFDEFIAGKNNGYQVTYSSKL
jgi:hypothetical protein